MGRGKRRTGALAVVVPVGTLRGRYAGVTAGFESGDTCQRECARHGLQEHVLRVAGTDKRWRCRVCEVENTARRRETRKQLLVAEAGGKCLRCDYDKYIGALEFHHRDPAEKNFGLTSQSMARYSMKVLREEAVKCDLLCSNCHSEVEAMLDAERDAGPLEGFVEQAGRLYDVCPKHGRSEFYLFNDGRRRCKHCIGEAVTRRQHEVKRMLVADFGGQCQVCGYKNSLAALEFHHRDPREKEFGIGKAGSISYKRLKAEAEKCDLLCSNCHKERHATELELAVD